ncbi:MAG: hypothetical protein HY329_23275 [Chloroflexi bacterium]|nr:hypothetical protein [Chloroflexota bacterium]
MSVRQQAVAQLFNVDRANISRRLAGALLSRPTVDEIVALSRLLRMDEAGQQRLLGLAGYKPGARDPERPWNAGGDQQLGTGSGLAETTFEEEDWGTERGIPTGRREAIAGEKPTDGPARLSPEQAWRSFVGEENPADFLYDALCGHVTDLLTGPEVLADPVAVDLPENLLELLYTHAVNSIRELANEARVEESSTES